MGSIFCCFFDTTSEEESKNGHFATAEAGSQARVKGVSSDVQALKRADQSHLLNQLTNLPNNKSIRTEIVLGKTVASVGSESKLSSATGTNIKNITTTTKYKFNNHLTNALDQAKDSKEVVKKVGHRLAHDQKLKKTTVHGFEINGSVTQGLMAQKDVERQQNTPGHRQDIAIILEERFSTMHCVVPGIYLTDAFGLQRESFAEAKIWVVVNATYEIPMLQHTSDLLTYRVPVEDDPATRIDAYFDDVADLLETARRRGKGAVVHCVAGVSRSTTLVLAYLLKYTDMSLRVAFRHTKAIRPVVRPNMSFMAQLMEYEGRLKGPGQRSTTMVTVLDRRRKVTVTVPDFYKKEFPDLYEWEVNKQMMKGADAAKK